MEVRVVLGARISDVAAGGREDVDLGLIPKRGHCADLVNRVARRIKEGDGVTGQLTVNAGEAFEGVSGLVVAHVWCDRTPSDRTTEDLIRPQDRVVTSSDNEAWVAVRFTRITDPDVD